MRQKIILLALMLLLPITASAWFDGSEGGYDFEVDSIYYEIVSETPPKVSVCSKSWSYYEFTTVIVYSADYYGDLEIPSEVTYNGTTYAVTDICWNAFMGCSDLESIVIPASISNIKLTDYYANIDLEVPLPTGSNGVKSIIVAEGNAIYDSRNECDAIIETSTNRLIAGCDNTTIPNSVTSIGTSAFVNCDGLINLHLPNTVTEIGPSAFAGCSNLNSIEIPDSVTYIGMFAFGNSGITEFCWPSSANSISKEVFYCCNALTNVTIPNTVTIIEGGAFYGCCELTSIEIPNSVQIIESHAFVDCAGLTSIEIPNSVTTIGYAAFYNCRGLTSVILGNSVTSIRSIAFADCSNLAEISISALTPPSVNYSNGYNYSNTFDCYNRATLHVPRRSYDAYINTNGWKQFCNIQSISDLEKNGIYYNFTSDSTVCVTFRNESYNSYSGDIVIPESVSYNGKDYIVNAIDERAFYNCSGLTSITIPNTITRIGNYAFCGCSGLTRVDIPNSISIISYYAFSNCTGLLNVNIPDSLQTIGNHSFMGCTGLASLTIGKSVASIGNGAFYDCYNIKELIWNAKNCSSNGNMSTSNIENVTIGPEVEILPEGFAEESKITEVTIPNSVTAIGNSAFYNCSDLKSITIPNSVNTIGSSAFYGCYKLISVIIPNSVTSIGDKAFYGCGALCAVEIPNSIASIGNYVFKYCSSLKTITIPNSVSSIGDQAFYGCSHMMSVGIPSSVTTIGSNAFYNCNALSKVTISDVAAWCNIIFEDNAANPLYYSHHLYLNNQEIKYLDIPEGVTAINNYAFINGTSFIDLTLPYTLESVGNNAFEGCKRLSNVALGLLTVSIGSGAFKDCTAISSVTCMAPTPPTMAAFNCFDNDCYDWAFLYVPGDKVDEYKSTIYWNKFANTFGTGIEVDGLFYLFDPDEGEATVTYKDETYCSYTGEVTIPETVNYGGAEYTVTGIGKAAFAYCDELTSVAIPNTVTSIGDYAFMYCEGLTSITIPNSVTSIGDNSFDGCGALCAVEILNSVASIGDMAFQGCTSLTDLTIGSDVTSIGAKAFNYCNSLHSVTCMGSVPPLMDNSDCFTSYGYEATLKVPQTSIEDYQSSNYWYKFAVIEGFNLSEPGDVNGDGGINISDVTALIDLLLSGGEISAGADVNGDGQVNISDVTALIDRLLSGN